MAIRVPAMELLATPPPFLSGRSSGGRSTLQKPFPSVTRKMWATEEAKRICRVLETRGSEPVKKRDRLWRGTVSPPLPVPDHISRPPYVGRNILLDISSEVQMHDSEGIAHMRAACELAARVLEHAGTLVRPSVTTNEIDEAVHEMIVNAGAYPSPLGYGGFPKSVCTSVNECMCHGIPDSRQLQDGDIINIDVTVYLNGYHGDTSETFLCGEVDEPIKQLVKVTEECMLRGISACKDGASFKTIGERISEHAREHGYGMDSFIGHGIGRTFHSQPIIWHTYKNEPGCMVEGQTFTIEPTLTMGSTACVLWDDGWTAVAIDGSLNAQFEHTILVTKEGAEILTRFLNLRSHFVEHAACPPLNGVTG